MEPASLFQFLCINSRRFLGILGDSPPSQELKDAIDFLAWKITPSDVIVLSRFVLVFSLALMLLINFLMQIFAKTSIIMLVTSALIPLLLSWLITEYPKSKYKLLMKDNLGSAPELITLLASSLEQNPNLERAVSFASNYVRNKLGSDLKRIYFNAVTGVMSIKQGLENLANKWGRVSEPFKASIYLLKSSITEISKTQRSYTLSQAVTTMLEGIVSNVRDYLNNTRIHTMIVFSFGTIIPLVIVSLLPVLSVMGDNKSSLFQIIILLSFSLLLVLAYTNKIIKDKPVTFSRLVIKAKPKLIIAGREISKNPLIYGVLVFLACSSLSIIYLVSLSFGGYFTLSRELSTLPLVAGLGVSMGVYCFSKSNYVKKLRDHNLLLESQVLDAVYVIGSKACEGKSLEKAISDAALVFEGKEISGLLKRAVKFLTSRSMSLRKVFSEDGVLRGVYSLRVKSLFVLMVNATSKSAKIGAKSLERIYTYFQSLRKVDLEAKALLKQTVSMMNFTAIMFSPIISGLVVILEQIIQKSIEATMKSSLIDFPVLFTSPGLSFEFLQLVLGIYALALCLILVRFTSILEFGSDEVMLNSNLSKGLIVTTTIFIITLVFARSLLA